jgi:hypothetical protein
MKHPRPSLREAATAEFWPYLQLRMAAFPAAHEYSIK